MIRTVGYNNIFNIKFHKMLVPLSKILLISVLIQCVTSVDFYKSKRVRPAYKEIKRARLLKSKEDNNDTILATTTVSESTEQEKVSIDNIQTTEVNNLTTSTIKLKGRISNVGTPVLGAKRVMKNKRRVLVQKRRLDSERKTVDIENSTSVDTILEKKPEVDKQEDLAVTQTTEYQKSNDHPTTSSILEKTPKANKQRKRVVAQTIENQKSNYHPTTPSILERTPKVYKQREVAVAQTTEYQRSNYNPTTPNLLEKTPKVHSPRQITVAQTTEYHNSNNHPTTPKILEKTPEVYKQREIAVTRTTEYHKRNYQSTTPYTTFEKQTEKPFIPIVGSENYVYAYAGDYHYSYEGGDGTKAFERGESRPANDTSGQPGVVGGYSYTDKDGNDYSLTYTAGKDGYRPVGAHLPTSPPIPPAIQRVLRILATKTTPEPITESVDSFY